MPTVANVVEFLRQRELTVATAESCTSGLVAATLTDIPGSGAVFEIGYVVYSERAKQMCLDVNPHTIETYGLTSEEVAREMAQGALARSHSDVAVAITGTAESNDELNGVVCFAYAIRRDNLYQLISETISFDGERNQVRKAAAEHAILSLPDHYMRLQQ